MKKVVSMDRTGDTVIEFDETEAMAGAKLKARELFDRIARVGAVFSTKRANGEADKKITSFDQIEDNAETVLVPAIVAG